MLSYKMDFSSCNIMPGFGKPSHIYKSSWRGARNREIYMHIVRKMSNCGFEKSFEQCREKIKKLRKKY